MEGEGNMGIIIMWLAIALGVILLDLMTSTFLFVWFSFGSLAAIIANLAGLDLGGQVLIFAVVSLISISIGYPWAKKKYKEMVKPTPLMEETYIGMKFTAQEDIQNQTKIKVSGIYWTGINHDDIILKGHKFQITGIEGNKLIIKGLGEE